MVIFAETEGKKDDQHENKEPPEVQGGSRHGGTIGESDIECIEQEVRSPPESENEMEEPAERAKRKRFQGTRRGCRERQGQLIEQLYKTSAR